MTWQIALFVPAALGASAILWFLGTAYFRARAQKCLYAAMEAAREKQYAQAKRLTEMAVGVDEYLRRVDALHAFYVTIQSSPAQTEVDAKVTELQTALEQRKQNLADRLWSNPALVQFIVWLFVIALMIRACGAITG